MEYKENIDKLMMYFIVVIVVSKKHVSIPSWKHQLLLELNFYCSLWVQLIIEEDC